VILSISDNLLRFETTSMIVRDEIKTGSLVSSSIWQTRSVPCSGWYLLKRALVSIKNGIPYRPSLSSITLLEREMPIFDKLCCISFKEIFTRGCFLRYLWSFELTYVWTKVFSATFGMVINHLLLNQVYQRERKKSK